MGPAVLSARVGRPLLLERVVGVEMKDEIDRRSVIVTGGTKGIGYGIAEVFAEAGDHVTIVGRDLDTAAKAASRLAEDGGAVDYVVADISKPEECARMADEVLAARGAIDVVCAN